jgi:hypothetical protein
MLTLDPGLDQYEPDGWVVTFLLGLVEAHDGGETGAIRCG